MEPELAKLSNKEKDQWREYADPEKWIGVPPSLSDKEDVAIFRAYMVYQKLLDENDSSVASIPDGNFIVVHAEKGIVDSASNKRNLRRPRHEGEYVFLHDRTGEHAR